MSKTSNKTIPMKGILKILTLLLPVLLSLLLLQRNQWIHYASTLPECPFHAAFGLYCPACGNTRSISALLHGRLLSSLHYNITPILLLLLCLGAYIELVSYSFDRHFVILPRKSNFYLITTGLWLAYLVTRNFIPCLMP